MSQETKEKLRKANITHNESVYGDNYSAEYGVWNSMKARCYIKTYWLYKYAGGKGIKMCDEWKNSYETFLKDMGRKPSHKHVLSRIDSSKDYSKENCKWMTRLERGVKDPRAIIFNGITMRQASRNLGISLEAIRARLKMGWPIEKAFTTPLILQTAEDYRKSGRKGAEARMRKLKSKIVDSVHF